jgi:hypothetical protein
MSPIPFRPRLSRVVVSVIGGVAATPAYFGRGRHATQLQGLHGCDARAAIAKEQPPGVASAAWGFTPGRIVVTDDARNIEGIGIRHTSKRRLSANGQQCGGVEGASISRNSNQDAGPARACPRSFDRRRRVRREIADDEHLPQ